MMRHLRFLIEPLVVGAEPFGLTVVGPAALRPIPTTPPKGNPTFDQRPVLPRRLLRNQHRRDARLAVRHDAPAHLVIEALP